MANGEHADPNLYDEIERVIALQRETLQSGALAGGAAESWSDAEIDAKLGDLEKDQHLLDLHREVRLGTSAHPEQPPCRECGEPRPCGTARRLAAKYQVSGRGDSRSTNDVISG